MARSARYAGEDRRRPWYQLEERHAGILAARLVAAAALAAGALALPRDVPARDIALIVLACAAAAALHGVLWAVPVRWPRRLRLAVDVGLVVDVAWAGAVAWSAGGSRSPLVGLFVVTALWAALGYSARTGVKGGVLASMAFLTLVWADDGRLWSAASLGRLALFWAVLAAAVMGAAAGERELRIRAERLAVLHDAALGFLEATSAPAMLASARAAVPALVPGWVGEVSLGPRDGEVRLSRSDRDGVITVPVFADARVVGAIECRRALGRGRVRHRVRLREIDGLETLAAGLGSALWRVHLTASIERQSLTDGLTGIANRRAFDVEIARRVADVARFGGTVSLCLLDVDHFKAFNDTFGHQAGDSALAAVARTIRETCRATDIPTRYGGEEMAVIMPGLDADAAVRAAERIRAAIAATRVGERAVSVSVGVAATAGGCSVELLVEAADRALYEAKRGGRNRVVAGAVSA